MRLTLPVLLFLAAAAAAAPGAPDAPEAPRKSCNDAVPKECSKVQFLGEENDCACFVCNPGTKTRKVVCTKDDATKRALRKLQEDAPAAPPSAPAAQAPR